MTRSSNVQGSRVPDATGDSSFVRRVDLLETPPERRLLDRLLREKLLELVADRSLRPAVRLGRAKGLYSWAGIDPRILPVFQQLAAEVPGWYSHELLETAKRHAALNADCSFLIFGNSDYVAGTLQETKFRAIEPLTAEAALIFLDPEIEATDGWRIVDALFEDERVRAIERGTSMSSGTMVYPTGEVIVFPVDGAEVPSEDLSARGYRLRSSVPSTSAPALIDVSPALARPRHAGDAGKTAQELADQLVKQTWVESASVNRLFEGRFR